MRAIAWLLLTLAGCASVSPDRAHRQVSELVQERTGQPTGWGEGAPEEDELQRRVDELLAQGISPDVAVAVALLNGPRLQATYEELGIAQAELVQAGLLRNPRLGVSWLLALRGSGHEVGASLVGDLLSALVLPMRKRIAREQYEAQLLVVADRALQVVADVRQTVTHLQALDEEVALAQAEMDTEGAAAELSLRLWRAGNISQLDLAEQTAAFQRARLELSRLELERRAVRESLNRHLGLWGERTHWRLAGRLATPTEAGSSPDELEAVAISKRLDMQAARLQLELFRKSTALARTLRFVGEVEVGLRGTRELEGSHLLGPTLTLELPIFDQRQALLARLDAQSRQASRRVTARAIDIRSEVRLASSRLEVHRQQARHHREVVLPLRREVLAQAQLQYNAMQNGLFRLLLARRELAHAEREHVQAVRDFWMAQAELERVVGGRAAPSSRSAEDSRDAPIGEERRDHEHGAH